MKDPIIIDIDGIPHRVISITVSGVIGDKPHKLSQATMDRILAGAERYTMHGTRTGRWKGGEVSNKPRLDNSVLAKPCGTHSGLTLNKDGNVTFTYTPVAHPASTTAKKAASMPPKSTLNPHQKIAAKLSPGAKAVLKAATATSTPRADLQKNSGVAGRQFAPALRRLTNTGCLTASGEGEKAKFKRSAIGNKVFGTLPA